MTLCPEKIRYATRGDAKDALRAIRADRGRRQIKGVPHEQRAYLCPFCAGFHLTHQPAGKRRAA